MDSPVLLSWRLLSACGCLEASRAGQGDDGLHSWVLFLVEQGLDDLTAELAELLESAGMEISQTVVIQTE